MLEIDIYKYLAIRIPILNMKITSLSKLSVLLLLLQKPCHGYEVIKGIAEKFGYSVSPGQIYPFLSSLVKVKFLSVEQKGNRDKKIYSLTPKGREFANKVVESFDELIALAVSKKVHECAHCGCKVFGVGYSEKIRGKKVYFCCASCAKSFAKH